MKKDHPKNEITLETITAAKAGDENAMIKILERYAPKIIGGCSYDDLDEYGHPIRRLDEDMKSFVQMTLIQAIQEWRELI